MRVAIVGGGLAAAKAVEELRSQGHDGSILLFGSEPHLPYNGRPCRRRSCSARPTSPSAFVHDEQWYADHDVELHLGTTVTGLDLDRSHILVGTEELPYDRLLLATGASPRRLAAADDAGIPVAYLRTLEDSRRLRAAFGADRRIVIVGGGWIGLEVAAAARMAGSDVTVVEPHELPLLRVLGPEVATTFANLHLVHGVDLRLGASIESFESTGSEQATVRLGDGSDLRADLVVVGIGVEPRDELARAAGLAVDNGVLVDERLRTADPHVYAAGDLANHQHPTLGRRIRVEHWDNAIHQGQTAARNMLGGDEAYTRLPYFFTDQYERGMEYVGSVGPDGYAEVVVRGDPTGPHTAFWLDGDGKILAGMHVDDWDAIDPIRALVGTVVVVCGAADELKELGSLTLGES